MPSLPPPPSAPPSAHSPCVRLCTLNDDEVCLGCGRTLQDIIGWTQMSEAEKVACVARAQIRTHARLAGGQ